jgi:hypothetical protein
MKRGRLYSFGHIVKFCKAVKGFKHIGTAETIQREALHQNIGPAEIRAAATHAVTVIFFKVEKLQQTRG